MYELRCQNNHGIKFPMALLFEAECWPATATDAARMHWGGTELKFRTSKQPVERMFRHREVQLLGWRKL